MFLNPVPECLMYKLVRRYGVPSTRAVSVQSPQYGAPLENKGLDDISPHFEMLHKIWASDPCSVRNLYAWAQEGGLAVTRAHCKAYALQNAAYSAWVQTKRSSKKKGLGSGLSSKRKL